MNSFTLPRLMLLAGALATSASAAIVYIETFDSAIPSGWSYSGSGDLFTQPVNSQSWNQSNGWQDGGGKGVLFFQSESRPGGVGNTSRFTADTGVAYVANTEYSVSFTTSNIGSFFAGQGADFSGSLYAGDPGTGGLLLGSFIVPNTSTGDYVGTISAAAIGSGSGNLYLRFDTSFPTVFPGAGSTFGQANLDSVSIAAIPEPSSFAVVAAALALGVVATRRRRLA